MDNKDIKIIFSNGSFQTWSKSTLEIIPHFRDYFHYSPNAVEYKIECPEKVFTKVISKLLRPVNFTKEQQLVDFLGIENYPAQDFCYFNVEPKQSKKFDIRFVRKISEIFMLCQKPKNIDFDFKLCGEFFQALKIRAQFSRLDVEVMNDLISLVDTPKKTLRITNNAVMPFTIVFKYYKDPEAEEATYYDNKEKYICHEKLKILCDDDVNVQKHKSKTIYSK